MTKEILKIVDIQFEKENLAVTLKNGIIAYLDFTSRVVSLALSPISQTLRLHYQLQTQEDMNKDMICDL